MPGRMSGQGTRDMYVTWDATNLYLGMTGTDLANGDMVVYFDIKENNGSTDGDTRGEAGKVAHGLPFPANYAFWQNPVRTPERWGCHPDLCREASASRMVRHTVCWDGRGSRLDRQRRVRGQDPVDLPREPTRRSAHRHHHRGGIDGQCPAVHPTQTIDSGSVQQNFTEFCSSRPSSKAISRMERSRPSRSSTAPTSEATSQVQ